MSNLINAVVIFGHVLSWDQNRTAIILIIIQALLIIVAVALILYVLLRRRYRNATAGVGTTQEVVYVNEPGERAIIGLSLDLEVVQRDFAAGDDFSCAGLVVRADYNIAPTTETLVDYTVIDNDTYVRLEKRNKATGVYVIKPYMYRPGKKIVTIKYNGFSAAYTISVTERSAQPVEEPVVEQVVAAAEPVVVAQSDGRPRELLSISLNTEDVTMEYVAGESLDHEGLVVTAHYSAEPFEEEVVDYSVLPPDMTKVGKPTVTVTYQGKTVGYRITIKATEQPEPVVQEQPVVQEPIIVQQEPIIIERSVEEKTRELMSISINTDNVQKEFVVGDALDHEGLVVTAHYNVEPLEESVEDYSVLPPDMNKAGKPTVTVTYQGKTVGYRITINPAPEVMVDPEPAPIVEEPVVVEPQPTVIIQQRPDPIIVEEESVSSRLRYDKSFTARLIQSDDDTKYWYTDLKNELLSFKSVHARISWKRETFKCHKDVVAKLAYRGKQLCIFLPLNPADYMDDNNHPVEDASDMSCYEDTPLMIRLKSKRRVKFAKQLIQVVMDKLDIVRIEREAVDYYMPYEGILELINKGLIKREIKTPEDEKVFEHNNPEAAADSEEDDTFALTEVAPGIYVTKKD